MAYYVSFPFTVLAAAKEFLREMEEHGWHGTILDSDTNEIDGTPGPRLRLVSDEEGSHSIRVEEV
jgi:hypothetical protein